MIASAQHVARVLKYSSVVFSFTFSIYLLFVYYIYDSYSQGRENYTPLHKACYYGYVECVQWLVWNVADMNKRTIQGWTPAHIASIKGQSQCIEVSVTHYPIPTH